MAKPYTIKEQMSLDFFKADRMLAVYFAGQKFDNVLREDDKQPYYSNLTSCFQDARVLKTTIEKYRISDEDIEFDLTGRLSEDTSIRGAAWSAMKSLAFEEDYQTEEWFLRLTEYEQGLVERLKAAQIEQGDMEKLQPKEDRGVTLA